MTARPRFTIAWSVAATGLIVLVAYLLALRLPAAFGPQDGGLDLDISGLAAGELRTYTTWEGEFWLVHRSPEQIAALKRQHADGGVGAVPRGGEDAITSGALRSADPEYFVFRVQRIGEGIMLKQQATQYFVCSDLRLFRGERAYPGGYRITDGLSCADDPQIAYDLAGMPASPYFAALEVPEHEVRRGKVILRPQF